MHYKALLRYIKSIELKYCLKFHALYTDSEKNQYILLEQSYFVPFIQKHRLEETKAGLFLQYCHHPLVQIPSSTLIFPEKKVATIIYTKPYQSFVQNTPYTVLCQTHHF